MSNLAEMKKYMGMMPMTGFKISGFHVIEQISSRYKQLIIFYTQKKSTVNLLPIVMNPFISPCKLLGLIGPPSQLAILFPDQLNPSVSKKSIYYCCWCNVPLQCPTW